MLSSHPEPRGDHPGLFVAMGPTPPSMKSSITSDKVGVSVVFPSSAQSATAIVLEI